MITRRQALQLLGSAAAHGPPPDELPGLRPERRRRRISPSPGPLGDVAQGPADAKVTIIEYASLTCSHCAAFHHDTYPELKKRYIDTGKVRFILREFPLDPLATAGFMLARCDGEAEVLPDRRPALRRSSRTGPSPTSPSTPCGR